MRTFHPKTSYISNKDSTKLRFCLGKPIYVFSVRWDTFIHLFLLWNLPFLFFLSFLFKMYIQTDQNLSRKRGKLDRNFPTDAHRRARQVGLPGHLHTGSFIGVLIPTINFTGMTWFPHTSQIKKQILKGASQGQKAGQVKSARNTLFPTCPFSLISKVVPQWGWTSQTQVPKPQLRTHLLFTECQHCN